MTVGVGKRLVKRSGRNPGNKKSRHKAGIDIKEWNHFRKYNADPAAYPIR